MTIIVGRLTADAVVKHIDETKTVVNFTVAINDYYKPKDGEAVEHTEFVQCGYWYNTAIAASLKKGALVEVGGRLFATAYMAGTEIRPQINLQAQHIKVHVFAKNNTEADSNGTTGEDTAANGAPTGQPASGKNKNRGNRHKNKPNNSNVAQQQEMEGQEPSADLPF